MRSGTSGGLCSDPSQCQLVSDQASSPVCRPFALPGGHTPVCLAEHLAYKRPGGGSPGLVPHRVSQHTGRSAHRGGGHLSQALAIPFPLPHIPEPPPPGSLEEEPRMNAVTTAPEEEHEEPKRREQDEEEEERDPEKVRVPAWSSSWGWVLYPH